MASKLKADSDNYDIRTLIQALEISDVSKDFLGRPILSSGFGGGL